MHQKTYNEYYWANELKSGCSVAAVTDWILIALGVARKESEDEANYKTYSSRNLHAASRNTENAEENTSRHGLARWIKIFRVGQKFLMQLLKIFILG